ncbi:MAG: hypothetical protein ACFFEX_12180 [Candidatus Thorarchaeota archaeon]
MIAKARISTLLIEEAMEVFSKLRTGRSRKPEEFRSNGINQIRESLYYILYGEDDLSKRLSETVSSEGKYKLSNAGKDFISTILNVIYPDTCAIWNSAVEKGLHKIGLIPPTIRGESLGERYIRITSAIKALRDLGGFADFGITDEFISHVAHDVLPTASGLTKIISPQFEGFKDSDFEAFEMHKHRDKQYDDERCEVREKIEKLAFEVEPYVLSMDSRFILNISKCKLSRGRVNGIWAAFTFDEPYHKNPQLNFGIYNDKFTVGIEIPSECNIEHQRLADVCIKEPLSILDILKNLDAFWYQSGKEYSYETPRSTINEILELGSIYQDNSGWASFNEARLPPDDILRAPLLPERVKSILELLYPLYLTLLNELEPSELTSFMKKKTAKPLKDVDSDSEPESEIPPEASDYLRATRKMMKVIQPRHRRLSRKFAKWLANEGYDRIRVEKDQIDVTFQDDRITYMVEIKIVYKVSTKYAIREAIGQVLEYNYYEGRKPADNWIILIESEPTDDDIQYLKRIKKKHQLPLNLGWLKGSDFTFMQQF